jgi:sugar phosphate isomerase/epimerase
MFFGYNTNGLAHHALADAVTLLAEIGYRGVAITIDHHALSPFAAESRREVEAVGRLLGRLGMRSAIETGARFLLDPRQKHEPTLLSADAAGRRRRIEFYRYAIDCAAALGSDCVSLWSGTLRELIGRDQAIARLVEGLGETLDYADRQGVAIGFEPEPGMFIATLSDYESLRRQVAHPRLRLTLDVGHLHCQGETPIADHIRRFAAELVNVHIEDMRAGTHEHLMFGEGQIDFRPVLAALGAVGYSNGVYVELSRHSHVGPAAARQAFAFLSAM